MNKLLIEILKDSIEKEVFEYIVREYENVKELSIFELGIDSLDYMKLLTKIEERLDLDIEDLDKINTIYDIEGMIGKK